MAFRVWFIRSVIFYAIALGCSCFSFDASVHLHSSPHSLKKSAALQRRPFDVSSSQLFGATAGESNVAAPTIQDENQAPTKQQLDLHPPTLDAIAQGLYVRAQNLPNMPFRIFEDDEHIEPWEVTLSAGKVAQKSVEEWQKQEQLSLEENEEEMQVVGGRIVAVLTRLEELEEELLKRCNKMNEELMFNFGVTQEELNVQQATAEDVSVKQMRDAAAAIDAVCLFDEQLRYNRAKSLFAIFLHEIEGPGLRRNGVVLPCMDVTFLNEEDFETLLGDANDDVSDSSADIKSMENSLEENTEANVDNVETNEPQPSKSLHHVTIDAIEEAFRLRAQNSTTSPLRLLDSNMEWFEVQYSIMKFAERFLDKYTKGSKEKGEPEWTEEELQTIGGRIVGVLVRLDDLEWEWHHRTTTSTLGQPASPDMIPYNQWKSVLGLHPENVEQRCVETLDMALLEDNDFARKRAMIMLALFLLNIEGPAMNASGNTAPDGSKVDFIADDKLLTLMGPKMNQ